MKSQMQYPNWFAGTAQSNFAQYLDEYKGKDVSFLQLGAYTGDASVWLAENILTSIDSTLTDVDTWEGSDEEVHHTFDWDNILSVYSEKTMPYQNIFMFIGTTDRFFATNDETFDFVYVDADHTAEAVYTDGVNAWNVLKPGGILAFDDYLWGEGLDNQELAPKPGIDRFLDEHDGKYGLLHKGAQVWIRKGI